MNDFVPVETRRGRFLSIASQLSEQIRFDQLTPAAIAAAAKLPERDFIEEFGSVDEYLVQAHKKFLDGLLARMIQESGNLAPGIDRIMRSSLAQLNACLEQRSLRAWFAEARRKVPRVAEDLHVRNRGTAMMISIELKTLGCKRPMIIARLYGQMMLEAAQMEADAGGPIPELRQALRDFLEMWIAPKTVWRAA